MKPKDERAAPLRAQGRAWRWSVILLYLAALLTGTHLPEDHAAVVTTLELVGGDKIAHFAAYLGLAWLIFGLCQVGERSGRRFGVLFGLFLLGGVDELTQPFFGRPAEWSDWIADVLGLVLGMASSSWLGAIGTARCENG